jgi:radical SAM protein with 4Fe4S-binding SPASM domain
MKWKEKQRIVQHTSFNRISNAYKIWRSYHTSKKSGVPNVKGLPISLSIEPTTSCNLRCPECPSGLRNFTRPTGALEMPLFKKIIDETESHLQYLTFYFQGEPYLNPAFLDMVKYASDKKIYTSTSTNAHYLNDENAKKTIESGLDRLIISIDGTTQEIYEQYRVGGQLNKVLEGTQNIIKWKKELRSSTPYIIFQYLVVKPNEHQIADAQRLADELGVDELVLKTAQIYDYKNGSDLIPENEKYSRYKKNSTGAYTIKNNLDNQCWKMWHSSVITWDGNVVPCCFDKDAKYSMGNVQTDTFQNIWNNEKYQTFRTNLLKSRSSIDICTNCSEGTKVWAE